jgi:hypothetical protein
MSVWLEIKPTRNELRRSQGVQRSKEKEMSTSNTALQTLASRIFATAKGHAYDEAGSSAAIATILEEQGITPAVATAASASSNAMTAAQTAIQQSAVQLAQAHGQLGIATKRAEDAEALVQKHQATITELNSAVAERENRIHAMKAAAATIAAA